MGSVTKFATSKESPDMADDNAETDISYAKTAMFLAIGALRTMPSDNTGVNTIVRQLEISIDKLSGLGVCQHDWAAVKSPMGGVDGTCRKCGKKQHLDDVRR
jgi:hypothetical protein